MGPPGPLELSGYQPIWSQAGLEVFSLPQAPWNFSTVTWEKQVLSARQGVQARRKTLRIRYVNSMEVRKKRPWGFKKS